MGIPQDVLWDVTPDDELPNGRTTPTEMRAISWDVPRSAHQDERHSDPMDHPIRRPHDDGMPWWHAMGPKTLRDNRAANGKGQATEWSASYATFLPVFEFIPWAIPRGY